MNNFSLVGKVVAQPKLRRTKQNKNIAKFTVATTRGKDKEGNTAGVDYFPCCAFGDLGLECFDNIKEGSKVALDGRIHTSSYLYNGQKVEYFEVIINNIDFIDSDSFDYPYTCLKKDEDDIYPINVAE